MTLEQFAEKKLDRLYNPALDEDSQCTGWYHFKKMVQEQISPNAENMACFHETLRAFLIENWERIKTMGYTYQSGKYAMIVNAGKSDFYINGKYEHSIEGELSEEEFGAHCKSAAATLDFNYAE